MTSINDLFIFTQEQVLPARPEAYPIPTQTYTREYFTFPASRSQDRMGPVQNQWASYEEKPQIPAESNHYINNANQVRNNLLHHINSLATVDRIRIMITRTGLALRCCIFYYILLSLKYSIWPASRLESCTHLYCILILCLKSCQFIFGIDG